MRWSLLWRNSLYMAECCQHPGRKTKRSCDCFCGWILTKTSKLVSWQKREERQTKISLSIFIGYIKANSLSNLSIFQQVVISWMTSSENFLGDRVCIKDHIDWVFSFANTGWTCDHNKPIYLSI